MVDRLALSLACCLAATAAGAAEVVRVQTYEFLDNADRPFRYHGGLFGNSARSDLAGSFDVSFLDNGSLEITRFDVAIRDPLNERNHPIAGLENGEGLAERLTVDPVGLIGVLSDGEACFDSRLEANFENQKILFELAFDTTQTTRIRISSLYENQVSVFIQSDYGAGVLDAPSFATGEPGLLAVIVPEPAALLAAVGFLGLATLRHRPISPYYR